MNYHDFIAGKLTAHQPTGIDCDPSDITPLAKPFQRDVIRWAAKTGRAGMFMDCGLGKTLCELEWARLIWTKNRDSKFLLLCPIAVAWQVLNEVRKFNMDLPARIVRNQDECGTGVNITNYEKLHHFDTRQFLGCILNEGSILKGLGPVAKTLRESFAHTPYRLVETATPAPNDYMELGNHSEFLSVMNSVDMLSMFFVHDGGNTSQWRLRGHARGDFWKWMSSWSVAISRPSDIGHDDEGYDLPPMQMHEHVIDSRPMSGRLFSGGNISGTAIHGEKRASLDGKCELVSGLVRSDGLWTIWVDTNYEADALLKCIPDAIDVRGSDSEDAKAEKLQSFTKGEVRILITKPEIGGFGLNWEHCHQTVYFAGFSFERWYQALRRHWRFGQTKSVQVHMVMSENEQSVMDALRRKSAQAVEMTREMSTNMKSGMMENLHGKRHGKSKYTPSRKLELPRWIATGSGCAPASKW